MDKLVGLAVVIGLVLAMDFVVAWPVMLAWNCVVPVLTKLPEIGFWQAFSILFLMGVVKTTLSKN